MKSFMEEYGIIIVVIIVLTALIATAYVFKDNGTESFKSVFNSISSNENTANTKE